MYSKLDVPNKNDQYVRSVSRLLIYGNKSNTKRTHGTVAPFIVPTWPILIELHFNHLIVCRLIQLPVLDQKMNLAIDIAILAFECVFELD